MGVGHQEESAENHRQESETRLGRERDRHEDGRKEETTDEAENPTSVLGAKVAERRPKI
jgi:hypothetical protein